ncbi:5-formyltetrahydrofolate cyclo-ligase [Methanospirillum lacunae]|uniref:5-formyltetrahydrofolate cyclo-ligase n=1 Tax=Methanospirillum lacunae TaxID=668570 RepID=A0A2V2N0Y0_9EURY|nr:5-formyltetrahydrofolate cyclo-ligase [Methanospirillum lacunae]PWR73822.1 5-formyltetrahydrofolate cyclo-ligase [Methanospirillum lacunae]
MNTSAPAGGVNNIPIGKEVLRNILRERRWALSEQERQEKSLKICELLRDVVTPGEEILVYCAKDPEVETSSFISYLLEHEIPVIVPIIQKEDVSLRLSYLQDPSCLVSSTFHVPEPIGSEIPADPAVVTTAIIPMLGFDRSGARLGYGAGYYDRFLSTNRHIRTVGLAYSCQEEAGLPTNANDISMTIVVTEDEIINMGGGS